MDNLTRAQAEAVARTAASDPRILFEALRIHLQGARIPTPDGEHTLFEIWGRYLAAMEHDVVAHRTRTLREAYVRGPAVEVPPELAALLQKEMERRD